MYRCYHDVLCLRCLACKHDITESIAWTECHIWYVDDHTEHKNIQFFVEVIGHLLKFENLVSKLRLVLNVICH